MNLDTRFWYSRYASPFERIARISVGGIPLSQDAIRRVTPEQLGQLLAALPEGRSTRISIARVLGEYMLPGNTEQTGTGFCEYRNLAELGGFVVSGPTTVSDIAGRVGAGEYRVTAYGLDVPGMRWEVFVTLENVTHS